ncbi:toxic anion resistance protein [uncultured Brachyspira sp.]|uniref:toxic anion resistance protein n=1 Tax=uncultured Brachyspira sp. TaxID=221953 RepID=UPI0025ED2359|nr:toxic anion resistance protein [uncultured Brachyspira sp.]
MDNNNNNNLENNNQLNKANNIQSEPIIDNQPQNAAKEVFNHINSISNNKFTQDELKKIDEVANSINLQDSVSIMSYGAAAQNKMMQFSENTLSNVMNKDLGEIGDAITDVITELKGFNIENETKGKGLFGFFKKAGNNISKLKTKYTNVETNIDSIVKTLEAHQRNLLKDISILDQMYNYNLEYLKELEIYIEAGKQKLNNLITNEIPILETKAMASSSPQDVQIARDTKDLANRFEKRIHDLELTKTISVQTIPQIRLVQNNNVIMTEKIQSTISNTIPLWKNQMVLAIGLHHSNEAAKAQRAVTDTTNELLRKNADMLKTSTAETAKESERSIVDIETLKYTNEQLISTLDEVMKIQIEGREKRKSAEAELRNIENELKTKILNISKN